MNRVRVRVSSRCRFLLSSLQAFSAVFLRLYISRLRTSNHHEPTHVDTRSFVQNFLIEDSRAKLPGLTVRTGVPQSVFLPLVSLFSIDRTSNSEFLSDRHGTTKCFLVQKLSEKKTGKEREREIDTSETSRRGRFNVVAENLNAKIITGGGRGGGGNYRAANIDQS